MAFDLFGKKKKQEEELQKALKQLAVFASEADRERNTYLLLLSSIGEAVFVLDLDKRITIVNKAAEEMIGKETQELIGKEINDVFKLVHKNKEPIEETHWEDVSEEKKVVRFPADTLLIAKNNNEVPVTLTVSPIVDKNTEKLQGYIMTLIDVRAERTLEEARVRFISTASHQLRTPMTSVRWYSEILMDESLGKLNTEQKHVVKDIHVSINRLIDLLNLLLQVSRIEANRVKFEPVPTNPIDLTKEVYVALQRQFDEKGQKVDILPAGDVKEIPMDKMIVWQVIQNLLTNACNYSPEKSTIEVHIKMGEDGLEYSVKDSGIGIPEEAKKRLFEKFYRADNAMNVRPSGSGIGLSLCKSLVEGWGGKIWFDSPGKDKGTTFTFTMPKEGMKPRAGEVGIGV